MIRAYTFIGAPCAGKSSVARKLAEDLRYVHFSSGEFIRQLEQEKTSRRGREVARLTKQDSYLPDHVMLTLFIDEIDSQLRDGGLRKDQILLLDGIPRTVPQASEFQYDTSASRSVVVHHAFYLRAREETLERRFKRRKEEERRPDDGAPYQERFDKFLVHDMPLVTYYDAKQMIQRIDAEQELDQVVQEVRGHLEKLVELRD